MSNSGVDHQRLHALDVTTGAELFGGPKEITASFAAPGGGTRTFDPGQYEERAALLLSQGTIYTSWTSHCDEAPYTGWIIAYAESTLAQTAVLNVAPNGTGSGYASAGPAIWMSGGGPAADAAGNVYLLTGNGAFETTLDANGFPSLGDYGNSFLKLATSGGARSRWRITSPCTTRRASRPPTRTWAPGASCCCRTSPTPAARCAISWSVPARTAISTSSIVTRWASSAPAATTSGSSCPACSAGASGRRLRGSTARSITGRAAETSWPLRVASARFAASPASQSAASFPYPGTAPAVSANGSANGIVWAHENTSPAVLHAYDAGNLAHELYNSSQAANGRDQFGAGNKFITPTIADGKVFVGTQTGVAVFGLLN